MPKETLETDTLSITTSAGNVDQTAEIVIRPGEWAHVQCTKTDGLSTDAALFHIQTSTDGTKWDTVAPMSRRVEPDASVDPVVSFPAVGPGPNSFRVQLDNAESSRTDALTAGIQWVRSGVNLA